MAARQHGVVARLQERLEDGRVGCRVCLRRCRLYEGQHGLCGNYANVGGLLVHVGYGLVSALESRPIEIKPFFHFHPGSSAMTFSGWGCNFLCPWCQNWHLSKAKPRPGDASRLPPEKLVEYAVKAGDDGVCASFNEPTISFDYLVDVFREARRRGLYTTMVSNGSLTEEALELLVEAGLDAINVDLKGCRKTYSRLIGVPDPLHVYRVARRALELGVHVEGVFLVVTGANDWDDCIKWVIDRHIEYLGRDVPLHINRYHPAYMYDAPATSLERLLYAYNYATGRGVEYVYIGNVASTRYLHTRCPRCGELLVRRSHYSVVECRLEDSRCPRCGYEIPMVGECRVSRIVLL